MSDLIRQARDAVRREARSGVFEFDNRALANLRRVFATPLPWPLHDLSALAMAEGLGSAVTLDPGRGRRLLEAAMREGGRPFAVVGDSHSRLLVRRRVEHGRWLLPVHRLCTGASARGLGNAASRSGWGERVGGFLAAISPLSEAVPILFEFGQVDVEFVFTFRRLRDGARVFDPDAFEAFCAETVERYLDFLDAAVPGRLKPSATVCSIFPPALTDAAWRQGYINAHIADLHGEADPAALAERLKAIEIPGEAERTRQHVRFNTLLAEAAAGRGYRFLDLFTPLLGPDGKVRTGYRGPARDQDHHLHFGATAGPIRKALSPLFAPPPPEALSIRRDDLAGEDVRALLEMHVAGMRADSPPGLSFALDRDGLKAPEVTVWTARRNGTLVGIAALKALPDGSGEIKSMRTHPDHLRQGVGAALLDHIIAEGRARGLTLLSLETGDGEAFAAALALYQSRGFVEGGPFADYQPSPFNRFFYLPL